MYVLLCAFPYPASSIVLWAGAGPPEGVHAGRRWGPMARPDFSAFFDHFLLVFVGFGDLAAMLPRLATACRRC